MLSLTVTLMVFKIPCSVSCNMFLFSFQVSGNTFCGLLAASDGIFRDCIKNAPALAASYGENCRFDVCANMDLPTPAKRAACGTLETFSVLCFDLGYGHVDWRTVADCRKCKLSPSPCPSNAAWSAKHFHLNTSLASLVQCAPALFILSRRSESSSFPYSW